VPPDVGMRNGIFQKNNVELELTAFAGDARMQQAAAADSIDILLGSGPAMAFIVKGAPIKGVAAMAGPPLLLAIVVRPNGPKTIADLKGKTVSVSTAGSLTYWLVSETARRHGWGPNGITIAPMGAMPGQIAALKRGIDGTIMDIGNAFDLEKKAGPRSGPLQRHQDFTSVSSRPTRRASKPGSCATSSRAGSKQSLNAQPQGRQREGRQGGDGKDGDISSRVYDELMPMFSDAAASTRQRSQLSKSYVSSAPAQRARHAETLHRAFLPAIRIIFVLDRRRCILRRHAHLGAGIPQ
jgi:hypothetical protein